MDHIDESPAKRRRTQRSFVHSQSQDDVHSELDETASLDDYETIPTLPIDPIVPRTPPGAGGADDDADTLATIPLTIKETPVRINSSQIPPSSNATQPTQIVRQIQRSSSPDQPRSVVQVAASSPAPAPAPTSPAGAPRLSAGTGSLISRMAPPGTAFRNPRAPAKPAAQPVAKPQPILIDSDDEGPIYVKDSDDEYDDYSRDLKPTVVKGQKTPSQPTSAQSSFSSFMDRFRHKSNGGARSDSPNVLSRPAQSASTSGAGDTMANAYGGVTRPDRPAQKQRAPAKAVAMPEISLDMIDDAQMRARVSRIRQIFPTHSVSACYQALLIKKNNENDAMEYLSSRVGTPQVPVQPAADDALSQKTVQPRKAAAKQQARPTRTIHQRYAAEVSPMLGRAAEKQAQVSPVAEPRSKKKRLVKGRKYHSSPPSSVADSEYDSDAAVVPAAVVISSEDDGDGDNGDVGLYRDRNLLEFLNTCTTDDLVDLAQTDKEKAEFVLSHRPFHSKAAIRAIEQEPAQSKTGSKRRARAVKVGDKMMNACETMWTAFRTVDMLVDSCSKMGAPIAAAMQKWGVDAYGSKGSGELEIVCIGDDRHGNGAAGKDSGLGSSPRSSPASVNDDVVSSRATKRGRGGFVQQPGKIKAPAQLFDYQVVGVNWLTLLYRNELSCILADDMGLGKTLQVIAFLSHLRETGNMGKHVIVVPSSVLENWLREFKRYCPDIRVMPYHARKTVDGIDMKDEIQEKDPDVVVTTYAIARKKADRKFLSSLRPTSCIYDEGHMLRNPQSEQYQQLMKLDCKFRLLLTGTPLQNNLGELIALLGFMMPDTFNEHRDDLSVIFGVKATTSDRDNQNARLLSVQRVERAKMMMTPFILRRKKYQVRKDLPAKQRRVQHCEMEQRQAALYTEVKTKYQDFMRRRAAGQPVKAEEKSNLMMDLRKAAIHPLLFRRLYTDETLRKMSRACVKGGDFPDSNPDLVFEDLYGATDLELHRWCSKYSSVERFQLQNLEWMESGKVKALLELLQTYRANGDRALVFSQFTMVLDVLEMMLEDEDILYSRLDGSVNINERQELINMFRERSDIGVFLLSTRAGGAGINLASANKVVIFDSGFNPQDDVQAENRAHRIGQQREVEVVRLVSSGTVEEQIHALGETKLALDEKVAGEGAGESEADAQSAEAEGKNVVEKMLAKELDETYLP